VGAANATISLPSGLTIDTSKVGSTLLIFGDFTRQIATASTRKRGKLIAFSGDTSNIYFTNDDYTAGQNPNTGIAGNGLFSTGETINFQILNLPILGWSSSVQMSDSADTRVVDFSGSIPTQSLTVGVTNIAVNAAKDSHGAWTGSTYVIPSAGDYLVGLSAFSTTAASTYAVYINGAQSKYISSSATNLPSGGMQVVPNLKVGDIISVRSLVSITLASDGAQNMSIAKIQGPQAIAASESVNARYSNTAGTSVANTGDVVIPFAVKDYDSHGAYVTDTYTVPIAGKYKVSAAILYQNAAYAVGNRIYLALYKNGSAHSVGHYNTVQAAATFNFGTTLNTTVNCIAGDTLVIRASNNRTAGATALDTTAGINYTTFERVGN
jgi:hypothetical protein